MLIETIAAQHAWRGGDFIRAFSSNREFPVGGPWSCFGGALDGAHPGIDRSAIGIGIDYPCRAACRSAVLPVERNSREGETGD